MKKFYFLCPGVLTLSFCYSIVTAQNTSPYWSLAGNSNATATSKLGTTNNVPLQFFTNNLNRMQIAPDGKVAIGTTSTSIGKLTVFNNGSTPSGAWFRSSPPIFMGFGENSSGNADLLLGMSSNNVMARPVFFGRRARGTLAAPLVVQPNDYLSSFLVSGYDGSTFQNPASLDFYVDGTPSAGHVPTRISLVTGTNVSDRQERLKVLNTGDFIFNNGQVQLINNGPVTTTGSLGVGSTPGGYKMKISHSTFGFDIENAQTLEDWEFWSNTSGLALYADGNFRGQFNPTTGVYAAASDERLKKNIKPMAAVMEKLLRLKASTYQFKDNSDQKDHDGFIAQDVANIFPALVFHTQNAERGVDVYSLDYSGFGVIAIKGIQELVPVINAQAEKFEAARKECEATISALELRITKLEAMLSKGGNVSQLDVTLDQNAPNPFQKNTIIRYTVPRGSLAEIQIHDQQGRLIKIVPANEGGQTELAKGTLQSGVYTYTLLVNGKPAIAKQMLVVK